MNRTHQLIPLIITISLVTVERVIASCLPSRDHSNWSIRSDLKSVNCFGWRPSKGWIRPALLDVSGRQRQ